ncbi:MAG: hypothetical protein U5M50_00005, partial [Sphingobium sp.]|nr:hypothetical protein [Sphingobium sp.]
YVLLGLLTAIDHHAAGVGTVEADQRLTKRGLAGAKFSPSSAWKLPASTIIDTSSSACSAPKRLLKLSISDARGAFNDERGGTATWCRVLRRSGAPAVRTFAALACVRGAAGFVKLRMRRVVQQRRVAGAVCAALRLRRCSGFAAPASQNFATRSLRSLRSNSCDESDHDSRCARGRELCAARCPAEARCGLPEQARLWRNFAVFWRRGTSTSAARRAVPGEGDFCDGEECRPFSRRMQRASSF